jgi:hypothetical protein
MKSLAAVLMLMILSAAAQKVWVGTVKDAPCTEIKDFSIGAPTWQGYPESDYTKYMEDTTVRDDFQIGPTVVWFPPAPKDAPGWEYENVGDGTDSGPLKDFEPPMDVPALTETKSCFDTFSLAYSTGWSISEDAKHGCKITFATCADKSRILLTAEDGSKHCVKFPQM